jgi:excisionase family DNA binding protein
VVAPSLVEKQYSTRAIARRLRVHVSTVRRWIQEDRLLATRTLGGHFRVSESALLEALRRASDDHDTEAAS